MRDDIDIVSLAGWRQPPAHRGGRRAGTTPSTTARANAPEEQVVGVGRVAAVLEEAEQVVVLPVQVPADLDGRLNQSGSVRGVGFL